MKRTASVKVVALAVIYFACSPAQAGQIFNYSFTNSNGNIPGTVNGQLVLGFSGNGTGPATSILVTSIPAGFPAGIVVPFDVIQVMGSPISNSFTVFGGQITGSSYVNVSAGSLPNNATIVEFALGDSGNNYDLTVVPVNTFDYHTTNSNAGATFTAAVPEPASITMLAIGLTAFSGLALRQRRKALQCQ